MVAFCTCVVCTYMHVNTLACICAHTHTHTHTHTFVNKNALKLKHHFLPLPTKSLMQSPWLVATKIIAVQPNTVTTALLKGNPLRRQSW